MRLRPARGAAGLGAYLRAAEGQSRRAEQVYLRRGCVSTAAAGGCRLSIQDAGLTDATWPSWEQEEALRMDVGKLLMKASDDLSVRRAFGTAYEKDDMLIIPVAMVAGGAGGGTGRPRPRDPAAGPDSLPEA